jgi:hypothetical protein
MIAINKRNLAISAAILGLCVGYSTPAYAQATRTWVSGVGDDVNPCSRTAPCKTFAGAISKTAAGGEIDCLDPGGFGTLTITKSITIDCTGTFGSVLNSGGINGFNVNDSASATPNTADVILRGLSINGAGTTFGLNGISFTSGRSLVLEDVFIQNQKGGNGISFKPAGAARLNMAQVTIVNSGGGVLVQPTGLSGSARAMLKNVRLENNTNLGFKIDTTGNTSGLGANATLDSVNVSASTNGIWVLTPGGAAGARIQVTNSTLYENGTGLRVDGALAGMRVGNTTVNSNTTGVLTVNGGFMNSYGDNRVDGNTTDGTFTGTILPKK